VREEVFSSEWRLHRGEEFSRAYERGLRVRRKDFTLRLVANELPFSRLGLAVGRKVGPAHVRNLLRRRLRELFRKNKTRVPAGWDLVFAAGPAVARLSYEELKAEFLGAVEQAGRKCSQPRSRGTSSSASSASTS
jgi:ribonuclease P protein component